MNRPICKIAQDTGDVPLECLFTCTRGCAEADEEGTRVIVAGSREITDYRYVDHAMRAAAARFAWGRIARIVSGGARGVDRLGERWARENGVTVKAFPVTAAEWNAMPRTAGHARNGRMAEYATHLVAVWDGRSGGTRNMIDQARKRGLGTLVANLATGGYE
jgi:YspA, cpYpsA-related SLOG family